MSLDIVRPETEKAGKPSAVPTTKAEKAIVKELKVALKNEDSLTVRTHSFSAEEFHTPVFDRKRLVSIMAANGLLCTSTEGRKGQYDIRIKPSGDDSE